MEQEMDWHLNNPPEMWKPWEEDAYQLWAILTGVLVPPPWPPELNESAPDWYSEAPSAPQNAA